MGSFYVCLVLYELRISQDPDVKSTSNNPNSEINHHYILRLHFNHRLLNF